MKPAAESKIEAQVKDLHPDQMTPIEALQALYQLKAMITDADT